MTGGTAIWGPLGWMTLHSVCCLYPETPTPIEKQLLIRWIDLFRDCITCPSCQGHFTNMYQKYRAEHPDMFDSRQKFAIFSFRAHNLVNKRLGKPIFQNVKACLEQLQTNVKTKTATEYRQAYLSHIQRHWMSLNDINGIMALKRVQEMWKIENEYFAPRSNDFAIELEEVPIVPPTASEAAPISFRKIELPRIRITAGGFRFAR